MKPGLIINILSLLFLILSFSRPAFADHSALIASVALENKDGPDQKVLTAVGAALNTRIFFQFSPFKRRLLMLKNGDIDMVCGLLKRPEREAFVHYILPPYKTRSDTIFIVPRGQKARIQTYEDLKGLKIGVTRGSKYFIRFDEDRTLEKDPVHQATTNFKKLILGRVDTMIIDESTGIDLIHRLRFAQQVEVADYRFNRHKSVYIGISKRSVLMERIQEVEPVIKDLIESGKIKQILTDYYTSRGLPVPAL